MEHRSMRPHRKTAEMKPFWNGVPAGLPLQQCFHILLGRRFWRIRIFLNNLYPVNQKDVTCLSSILWASKRKEVFFFKCYKTCPEWGHGVGCVLLELIKGSRKGHSLSHRNRTCFCVSCVLTWRGRGRGLIHFSYLSIVFFLVLFNDCNNLSSIPPVTPCQINVLVRFLSVTFSAKMVQKKQKTFNR